MPLRSRLVSRLTLWAFAAALLLKSAVPMLASAAAGLQGKALAEVCDVYGVDMTAFAAKAPGPTTAPAMAGPMTAAPGVMHHVHGHVHAMPDAAATSMHEQAPAGGGAPEPTHHASHSGDHCALTGMVALAADVAPLFEVPAEPIAAVAIAGLERADIVDAAARWAALLGHGPPVRS